MNNPYQSVSQDHHPQDGSQLEIGSERVGWLRSCASFAAGYSMPFVILILCNIIEDGSQQIYAIPDALHTIKRMHWPANINGWVMLLPNLCSGIFAFLAAARDRSCLRQWISRRSSLSLFLSTLIGHVSAFVVYPLFESSIEALPATMSCVIWSLATMVPPVFTASVITLGRLLR
ncbi:hypothetical protein SAMN06265222_118111 [Neorhodopirellula lusitana]|uniref:Uncharacterized protein n=1 Tax=Neorhodopirellula lusitana TaxID=445327 RepID=A0ABY1QMQ2_9BACT|nr:hypothetical protein SAMN06265222_118111 [Neorhodopirellula lusitana]